MKSVLKRNYSLNPLKIGELPEYEDVKYLYLTLLLPLNEVMEIFGIKRSKLDDTIKKYNLRRTWEQRVYVTQRTNMQKYGCLNPSGTPEFKERVRQTSLEKYGVDNVSKSKEVLDKIKQTNLERFGVEYVMQSNVNKLKAKQTFKDKYGVASPFQIKEVQNKYKAQWVETYGCSHPMKNKEVQNKLKQTFIEIYGVDNPNKNEIIKQKTHNTRWPSYFKQVKDRCTDVEFMFSIDDYKGVSYTYPFKCNKCETEFTNTLDDGRTPQCPICHPKEPYIASKPQLEVMNYVQSLIPNVEIIKDTRKVISPLELDIYIPSMNIAIEFCGLFWHSNRNLPYNYHYEKYKICKDMGIRLITLFEDEWTYNQEVVKHKLKEVLNLLPIVDVSNCTIIKDILVNSFLQRHSFNSSTYTSNISILLYGEIIGVMWIDNGYVYYCSNYNIIGYEKLYHQFKGHNIIVDNRWDIVPSNSKLLCEEITFDYTNCNIRTYIECEYRIYNCGIQIRSLV